MRAVARNISKSLKHMNVYIISNSVILIMSFKWGKKKGGVTGTQLEFTQLPVTRPMRQARSLMSVVGHRRKAENCSIVVQAGIKASWSEGCLQGRGPGPG